MEILQNVVSPFCLNITGKEERFMDLKMIKDHFNLPDKSYKELARHLRLVEVKEDELPASESIISSRWMVQGSE